MTLGEGTEATIFVDIVFWIISVSTIVAAIAVVQQKDLFRAALFLVVCFLGIAGLFVLMRAEFLAVIQLLIYVGAISVLIIFAILMTRDVEEGNPTNRLWIPSAALAILFGATAIFVIVKTEWRLLEFADFGVETSIRVGDVFANTIPWIARLLVRDFVLTFEMAGILLLAAIIGALVLVRER